MAVNYKEKAREARRRVLTIIHKGQTSHIASNFSCIDIATVLYEQLGPGDEVVWSKGWAAATIYYFLCKQGKLKAEELDKFPRSPYLGLAEVSVPGVLCSGGAMGHGLPIAAGMALGKKRAGEPGRVFCIMSDGEMQEGTTWESALIAAQNKIDNLVVLIDYNKWCAMGRTKEVADLEPFSDKWRAFGWGAQRIDGHDYEQLERALAKTASGEPQAIICDTIKGKGVSAFEDKILYHYKYVDEETYKKAMEELA